MTIEQFNDLQPGDLIMNRANGVVRRVNRNEIAGLDRVVIDSLDSGWTGALYEFESGNWDFHIRP